MLTMWADVEAPRQALRRETPRPARSGLTADSSGDPSSRAPRPPIKPRVWASRAIQLVSPDRASLIMKLAPTTSLAVVRAG